MPYVSITTYCSKCGAFLSSDGDDLDSIKVEPHSCVRGSTVIDKLIDASPDAATRDWLERQKLDLELKGEL